MGLCLFGEAPDTEGVDIVLEPESALRESDRVDWPPTVPVVFDANSDEASGEPKPEPEPEVSEEPEPEIEDILLRICYLFVRNIQTYYDPGGEYASRIEFICDPGIVICLNIFFLYFF